MTDLASIIPVIFSATAAGGFGAVGVQWLRTRGEVTVSASSTQVKLEENRDKLMFEVVNAAQQQIEHLTERVAVLTPLIGEVAHLREAMDHIRELLASRRGSTEEQIAADRRATAFIKRMERIEEALGTVRNEIQRSDSMGHLVQRNAGAPLETKRETE